MKDSKNIKHYKEKIIELEDKLLKKEKECSHLIELNRVHEMDIESLKKYIDDDKRYNNLIEHIEQQDNKISSLIKERNTYKEMSESLDKFVTEKQFEINGLHHRLSEVVDKCIHAEKQRDNWKADCEYNEECFQAERNRRWELEEQLNKIKNIIKDDKNEFYEKCPLKVLHVDTENDIILDKTENKNLLDDFEISDSMCNCYQAFFLIDKKRARSILFAMICGPVVSKSDFKMYDNFLEEDIMFIERVINDRYPFDIKRYHIDLRYGKVYDSEYALRFARKENKNG